MQCNSYDNNILFDNRLVMLSSVLFTGDCSLKCGLAQSIASNTVWNTKINGHYRHVFILLKHDML